MDGGQSCVIEILVAVSSKHGATREIATAIAHRLSDAGHLVTTVDAAGQAVDLDQFDAFVIGSAVYMGHWTKDEALKLLSTYTMPSIE